MALYNLKNVYDRKKFKEACNQMVLKNEYVELKKKNTQRSLAQNSYLHCLLGYFASEFGFTLEPKRMVHNNEQTLPTTTHNSEPTNFATII